MESRGSGSVYEHRRVRCVLGAPRSDRKEDLFAVKIWLCKVLGSRYPSCVVGLR